ncbi:tagaturonate reductase [Salipaludibacillus sp. HK11]|uniref:tagaturonate reductase n=1 Tax=Salipaludibacillus sp. HK11 TaxID=3394320 RepID=UPI0039FBB362
MKTLSPQLIKEKGIGGTEYHELGDLPERVLQFGEGNFLRAFVDWQIHQLNKQGLFNGKVVIYQPAPFGHLTDLLNDQSNLYTVVLRGMQNGDKVDKSEIVSSVSRSLAYGEWKKVLELASSQDLEFIFSNTTEAGITYVKEDRPGENDIPESFPAKITTFLLERFDKLGADSDGLTIITCELIEDNGTKLKEYVLKKAEDWELSAEFIAWVHEKNNFCSTLVDRIVTGYPRDSIEEYREQLGYIDNGLTVGEPYHMFAIDGDQSVQEKLPFVQGGLNVKWGDITPHREIKVRLLNGPHTMMFSVGHLYGVDTVQEVMETVSTRKFIERAFAEIKPTVHSEEHEKEAFVNSVIERFLNPYNKHYLLDIGLNAVYKFKSRLLPSIQRYTSSEGETPQAIAFSLASLFLFYKPVRQEGDHLVGIRDGKEYQMKENEEVLQLMTEVWGNYESGSSISDTTSTFLAAESVWGEDLNKLSGLHVTVTSYMTSILENGMVKALDKFVSELK